jgi:hypothetical protein
MRTIFALAAASVAVAALVTGCAATAPVPPPVRGSTDATAAAGQSAGGLRASEKEVTALTSGWIDAYAVSEGDGGKAVAAYAKKHASGRFQNEWESGDVTYVMRSYAVTGVRGDARTMKVTVRYDITSLREPVTTQGGKPTYRPASAFDVTYTWIKSPSGWQLDQITKTSDGSDFGTPVVYGK